MKFAQDLKNDGNEVNVERLRTLYAMMSGIPAKKVHMDMWRQTDGEEDAATDKKLFKSCGTQACLLGWAAAYPDFRKAGLKLDYTGWPQIKVDDYLETGFNAGAALFGLTDDQAEFLFSESEYYTSDLLKPDRRSVTLHGDNFDTDKTQKQVALDRIAAVLWKIGAINETRFKELLAESKAQAAAEEVSCCTK